MTPSPTLSRREFLAAANAAALLLLLESCTLGPIARQLSSPSVPSGGTPYEQALRVLRDAVRASPDHLAQRSLDLVGARDATRIVEFVRDRISALPPQAVADDPNYARWWGPAATLRGGQGTLRERADILADMLTRAGFAAQVSNAKRPSTIGLKELYAPRALPFVPDQGRIDLAKSLLRQAGAPAAATPPALQPQPDAAAAILSTLPTSLQVGAARSDLLPDRVPVVSFTDNGKKRYAFALGNLGIEDAMPAGFGPVGGASPLRQITITASVLANPAPGSSTASGRLIDLVSGTWPADVVVGRQVLLTFTPPLGPQSILDFGLASLPIRIPFLRVQTDAPAPTGMSLIVPGSPITMQGDVLPAATTGAAPAPGADIEGPFGTIKTITRADRVHAVARVASIKASVSAGAFPEIELHVAPTDATGVSIDGLDAAAFTIKEQGAPVDGFTLYSNVTKQQRPRVLVVYDANNVFGFWPNDAAKAIFESALATALATQEAKTPFDVQILGLGVTPDPNGWVRPQVDSAVAALRATFEAADDPWKSVGGAALDQGVTAIILISDNNGSDVDRRSIPMFQQRLVASGVPVFAVPVGQPDAAATTQIVSLSGGSRLDQGDPATPSKLVKLIAPLIARWVGSAYRLRYVAHSDGPTQRTVTVGLLDRDQPQAAATYQFPANPVPPPSFVGLYVTIQMPGLPPSFRRLAGVEVTSGGEVLGSLGDAKAAAETRAAMNGITTIAFEPGATTTAALLDDLLTSGLSIEPLRPLWGKAANDQLLKAVPDGVRRVPAALVSMLRAAPAGTSALPSIRVAILQERRGAASVELHGDFAIGVNPVISLVTDRHAAFKAVVATSVYSSAAEALTFGDSGYSRLLGRPLVSLATADYGAANAFINSVPPGMRQTWKDLLHIYQDYHVLAPSAGASDAFWVVDPATGNAKAVLLDGTGGGILTARCGNDPVDSTALSLAFLSIMCSYGGSDLYPLYCTGINTASAFMSAALLFTPHADAGTPFSLGMGVIGPAFGAEFNWFTGGVGVVLLAISMWAACG